MITIRRDSELTYPSAADNFNPDTQYPEQELQAVSLNPNGVYRSVRKLLQDAALDAGRFGTSEWNPLGQFIRPGTRVFILCNFVTHRGHRESLEEFYAKCTHASVLRPIIDFARIATGESGEIFFGNAPLQSCNWGAVLNDTGATSLLEYYRESKGATVCAVDLRAYVAERDPLGRVPHPVKNESPRVIVDLAALSKLNELGPTGDMFRVHDYSPNSTAAHHSENSHLYVINELPLTCDTIISVPKLKTHEKVGITCSLKGFVGTVADKGCLAHHRKGAPREGGDEYPNQSTFREAMTRFHEFTVDRKGMTGQVSRVIDTQIRRVLKRLGAIQGGAWSGNDTAWRMTLDLVRILFFAGRDGSIGTDKCRKHISFIDGVVAGEGDGPLKPRPRHEGLLLFSDDIVRGDWCAALLMGYDPRRIPMLARSCEHHKLDISFDEDWEIVLNGVRVSVECVESRLKWLAPRGWRSHLETKVGE